jgi:acetyl esterase/lipase
VPLTIDPQVLAGMSELGARGQPAPPVGDVETRRKDATQLFARLAASLEPVADIDRTDYLTTATDGTEVRLSWYRSATTEPPGSAVAYFHGGGMFLPLLPVYDGAMRTYAAVTGVPMLLVDYRVAPEHPHPAPVEDCYAGLCWLAGARHRAWRGP